MTGRSGNGLIVAVGDADRYGLARNADVNLVRANLFVDAGQPGYNLFADIDGNGLVRNADANLGRARLFVDPPAGPGPFRPIGGCKTAARGNLQLKFGCEIGRNDMSEALFANDPTRRPAARRGQAVPAAILDALFSDIDV